MMEVVVTTLLQLERGIPMNGIDMTRKETVLATQAGLQKTSGQYLHHENASGQLQRLEFGGRIGERGRGATIKVVGMALTGVMAENWYDFVKA
jgi:hypothetical protein